MQCMGLEQAVKTQGNGLVGEMRDGLGACLLLLAYDFPPIPLYWGGLDALLLRLWAELSGNTLAILYS